MELAGSENEKVFFFFSRFFFFFLGRRIFVQQDESVPTSSFTISEPQDQEFG